MFLIHLMVSKNQTINATLLKKRMFIFWWALAKINKTFGGQYKIILNTTFIFVAHPTIY